MSVKRDPILKRCRTLGIEPMVLGIDKNQIENQKRLTKKLANMECSLQKNKK